jgi:hypothetical protein
MSYPRVVAMKPINHFFHATLTLCTGGLWAPVWFLVWLGRRLQR